MEKGNPLICKSWSVALLAAVLLVGVTGTLVAARAIEMPGAALNVLAGPQESLTLYAVADATVRNTAPNTNFGGEHTLEILYSTGDVTAEAVVLVRFDLSSLPADAVIDQAAMELYLVGAAGDNPKSIAAYYVTGAWAENTVTWNTFPTAEPTGIIAAVDSVTGAYKSWTVTSWAGYWQSHPQENRGVYLRRLTSETSYFERVFESKDHNERMPRLVVRYHLPATATPTPTDTVVRPTPTPTYTPTVVRPTHTPTYTPTVARPTHTPTYTPTAVRPTPTPTYTPTVVRPTPTPTYTSTVVRPTPTPTGTPDNVQTVTLCAAEDAYVNEMARGANYGDSAWLYVGTFWGQGERGISRSLVRFDLSWLPADTEIHSAFFQALASAAVGASPVDIRAHPVADEWHEMTVTWDNQPPVEAAVATTPVDLSTPTVYSWDVTVLVREWVRGTRHNLGLELRGPESGPDWLRGFDSGEWSPYFTPFCPRLVLNFTPRQPVETPTPPPTPTPTPTPTSPCPAGDAGNSFAAATSLTLYAERQEYICPSGDVDWWKFPVVTGQEITLFLYDMPRWPDADYDLLLVNPTQGVVARSERWGADKDEYITHIAQQSGEYRALVSGKGVADWSWKHPYKLLARVCYPDEAGDDMDSAATISPGTMAGRLCPPGDRDWYQFTLSGANEVTINATLSNLPADYDLTLWGPSGQYLAGSSNPGTASEQINYTATDMGVYRLRVMGRTGAEFHATQAYLLSLALRGSDLSVENIEVTQAIQNLANQVPLVQSKTTYARVYVRASPADQIAEARLYGTRGGASLPGSPLSPIKGKILVRTTGGTRAVLDDSFYFLIPASWRSGTVTFRAEVLPVAPLSDPSPANNTRTVTLPFQQRRDLCVVMVRVHTDPQTASVNDPHFSDIIGWLKRAYPVPGVKIYDSGATEHELEMCWWGPFPYPCDGPYEMPDDSGKVLLSLHSRDAFTYDPCENTHYWGMVHPSHGPGAGGAAYINGWVGWGFMNVDQSRSYNATWYWPHGGATMAHELGHNLDRHHVNCGGPDDLDNSYPYNACDIGPDNPTAYFGFNVASPAVIAPTSAADLMSYGHNAGKPRWPSDYTYRALFNKLTTSAATAATAPAAWLDAEELLYVTGAITPTAGTAEFSSAYRLPQGIIGGQDLAKAARSQAAAPEQAIYHLRLLNAAGELLADQPFPLPAISDDIGPARPFQVILPFAAGAARLVVADEGGALAERPISPHAPAVHVLAPNGGEVVGDVLEVRWEGGDKDGDPLNYTVQYSPDEGATWQALATNVPTTTLIAPAAALPGSARALIRVIATDGVNTGSDRSDGPFLVPPHPPRPIVTSPANGASFMEGQVAVLSGMALDAEEGTLPTEALRWSSDRDGFLGEGDDLAIAALSPGRHVITLIARDSDGLVGETSVTIHVVRSRLYMPMLIRSP